MSDKLPKRPDGRLLRRANAAALGVSVVGLALAGCSGSASFGPIPPGVKNCAPATSQNLPAQEGSTTPVSNAQELLRTARRELAAIWTQNALFGGNVSLSATSASGVQPSGLQKLGDTLFVQYIDPSISAPPYADGVKFSATGQPDNITIARLECKAADGHGYPTAFDAQLAYYDGLTKRLDLTVPATPTYGA